MEPHIGTKQKRAKQHSCFLLFSPASQGGLHSSDIGGCCRIVPKPNATYSNLSYIFPIHRAPQSISSTLSRSRSRIRSPKKLSSLTGTNGRCSPTPAVLLSAIHDESRLKKQVIVHIIATHCSRARIHLVLSQ